MEEEKARKDYNRGKIKLILMTIPVFVFFTLLTAKCERPTGGNDTYGFPFTYHTIYSKMQTPLSDEMPYDNISDHADYNNWYLLLDILFAVAVVQLLMYLWTKTISNKKLEV